MSKSRFNISFLWIPTKYLDFLTVYIEYTNEKLLWGDGVAKKQNYCGHFVSRYDNLNTVHFRSFSLFIHGERINIHPFLYLSFISANYHFKRCKFAEMKMKYKNVWIMKRDAWKWKFRVWIYWLKSSISLSFINLSSWIFLWYIIHTIYPQVLLRIKIQPPGELWEHRLGEVQQGLVTFFFFDFLTVDVKHPNKKMLWCGKNIKIMVVIYFL